MPHTRPWQASLEELVLRNRETEVLSKRAAGVVLVEELAALEFGDQEIDDRLEPNRGHRVPTLNRSQPSLLYHSSIWSATCSAVP